MVNYRPWKVGIRAASALLIGAVIAWATRVWVLAVLFAITFFVASVETRVEYKGRSWRIKTRWIVVTLVMITLVVGGCAVLHIEFAALDGASLEQGQERAEDLIIALEMYRERRGMYPASLSALVPHYLAEIPRPAWRYEYYYDVCSNSLEYAINFREGRDSDNFCGINSVTKEWKCLDFAITYPPCN